MGNQGTLELSLLGVDGQPAADPRTLVSCFRTSDGSDIEKVTRSFPPARKFELPAFPQEVAIGCTITPERYRHREVGVFTLTHGETITRQPTVFRTPGKWSADFDRWSDLNATAFDALRTILGVSDDLRVKGGRLLGRFTESNYDDVNPGESTTINAKACLLNLFAKLRSVKEPVFNRKPWFAFLEELLVIGRERVIATAHADLHERVKTISDKVNQFPDYKRTPVGDHHKNIPAGYTFTKSAMVSIKTREDNGNLQLTVTPAKDSEGRSVTLVDADIDENGKLMAHFADLFKHRFSGGTHPFDIHEYLLLEDRNRPLGYTLE